MSRVVYIGNFEPPHSTENEVRAALLALGHEVDARQEQTWDAWVRPVDADVVLWTRTKSLADQVDEELRWGLLDNMKQRGIPTVGYHLDRWWGLKREREVRFGDPYGDPFFRVSLLCTADGGHDEQWKDAGVNHEWFPPAVSEFECGVGHAYTTPVYDLVFVGSWEQYGHPEWWPQRERMLEHVRSWYGNHFACFPGHGFPAIRGDALRDVYATAKVVIGDSCLAPSADGQPITRYWSDRIPETLGRGGILVHPEVEGLPCDMPVFTYPLGDMDALHEQIETLLSWWPAVRAKMREHAVQYVKEHDTYTVRMSQLWARLAL